MSASYHSCAVTTGGGATCWGANGLGSLGDGTTTNSAVPVDVVGLTSGVAAVTTGGGHSCALTTGGGVKCWGYGSFGQLGNGVMATSSTPVDVTGLSSGVAAISAGEVHTCALTTGGAVLCWGANTNGQLGTGDTTLRTTPSGVTGLAAGVAAVSAGGVHTCALTTGGGVKCWGNGEDGELGNGGTTQSTSAVNVVGLTTGATGVSAGERYSCAVLASGGARCWGRNDGGQLGNGTTTNSTTPVNVVGTSGISSVSAGFAHTCAVLGSGAIKCWGRNNAGQLGTGSTENHITPGDVVGFEPPNTDGDGCTDDRENQTAAGSEAYGGRRDSSNEWDFFDPNEDGQVDLVNDVFAVAAAFGLTPADAGYSAALDRSPPSQGGDPWDLQAPNGVIDLVTDIFGVAFQFGHNCT